MAKFKHTVLIVDDTQELSGPMGKVLQQNGIDMVYCDSAESGLKKLDKSDVLFSLIISNEIVQGKSGIKFLEYAGRISPSSIKILLSDFSRADRVIDAINRGAVQKVISKPWVAKDLISVMKQGFLSFKTNYENDRHVKAAAEKMKKIRQFDANFKARASRQKKKIEEMDNLIAEMRVETSKREGEKQSEKSVLYDSLKETLEAADFLDKKELEALFKTSLKELFTRFKNTAEEKGVEGFTIDL